VNYGGTGKMRYIKAEISLRTEDMKGAEEITHHLPLIRDKLIYILSQQTEESIATPEGKEKLRLFALAEVNKVMHAVEKGPEAETKAEDKKKDSKKDKKKTKDKADKKKSDKDKKSKDKKDKDESDEEDHGHSEKESHGPASDLFFNNFVVQK
jgi:flagellar protein FliL